MSLVTNRLFEKHLPSVHKIYTYNLLRESKSLYQSRVANQYRDVGNISRVIDFLVRGRQIDYKSAKSVIANIHKRKDKVQYDIQQRTFHGGSPCGSIRLTMDGLGRVKKIQESEEFSKLALKYKRDYYVSAYFQALQQAREHLYGEHLKINSKGMEELHEALSEFEQVRDEQRQKYGALSKSQAITEQRKLIQTHIDILPENEFDAVYGKSKQAVARLEDHEVLAIFESQRYLNEAVPVTPAEMEVGQTPDPLSVEAALFARAYEQSPKFVFEEEPKTRGGFEDLDDEGRTRTQLTIVEETEESQDLLEAGVTDNEIQFNIARSTEKQMRMQALMDANLTSKERVMKQAEISSMIEFETFVEQNRRTLYQLFGSLSGESPSASTSENIDGESFGASDPTSSKVSLQSVLSLSNEDEVTLDIDDSSRIYSTADYEISLENTRLD